MFSLISLFISNILTASTISRRIIDISGCEDNLQVRTCIRTSQYDPDFDNPNRLQKRAVGLGFHEKEQQQKIQVLRSIIDADDSLRRKPNKKGVRTVIWDKVKEVVDASIVKPSVMHSPIEGMPVEEYLGALKSLQEKDKEGLLHLMGDFVAYEKGAKERERAIEKQQKREAEREAEREKRREEAGEKAKEREKDNGEETTKKAVI